MAKSEAEMWEKQRERLTAETYRANALKNEAVMNLRDLVRVIRVFIADASTSPDPAQGMVAARLKNLLDKWEQKHVV